MKRDVLNSPRLNELKKRRRKNVFKKISLCLLGLAAIFILSAYFSKLENLNISEIQIIGNKVVETEALKAETEKVLAGKYLWLFPKTNILYYPQNSLKEGLQNKFRRTKDINLSIKDNKILEVSLSEREGKYLWCGTIPKQEKEKCYFSDESGYIFDEAPYFSGEVYFKFYGLAGPNPENPAGSYFLGQNFQQLISFKNILSDLGLKPVMLYATENGNIEIFLERKGISPVGPKIILKIDIDLENAAENLKTALDTEPLKTKFKEKYSKLQYIDLRFGNKVVYKFL